MNNGDMAKIPSKIVYLRIPVELKKELKIVAEREFRTVASVIRAAIEHYLNGGK